MKRLEKINMNNTLILLPLLLITLSSYSQNKNIKFSNQVSQIDSLISTNSSVKEKKSLTDLKLKFKDMKMGIGFITIKDSSQTFSSHSLSKCEKMNDTIRISNAIGFFSNQGTIVTINPTDSTYNSKYFVNNDDVKSLKKSSTNSNLKSSITLDPEFVSLFVHNTSTFQHDSIISGKIILKTPYYFEQNDSQLIQHKLTVESHFQCKLEDYDYLLELKGLDLKTIMKKRPNNH